MGCFLLLLGLFAFGVFTRRTARDRGVPAVALAAPRLCWRIDRHQRGLFGDWPAGLALRVVNGALTCAGLWALSCRAAALSR